MWNLQRIHKRGICPHKLGVRNRSLLWAERSQPIKKVGWTGNHQEAFQQMPKAVSSMEQALLRGLGKRKVLDCQEDVSRRKGVTQMGTAQVWGAGLSKMSLFIRTTLFSSLFPRGVKVNKHKTAPPSPDYLFCFRA